MINKGVLLFVAVLAAVIGPFLSPKSKRYETKEKKESRNYPQESHKMHQALDRFYKESAISLTALPSIPRPSLAGGIERLGFGRDPFGLKERYGKSQRDIKTEDVMRMLDEFSKLSSPVEYPFSSEYGLRKDPLDNEVRHHSGDDIAAPEGTPVPAVAEGIVITSEIQNDYGLTVEISHSENISSLYAHLSRAMVSVGDRVHPGQIIGNVGKSGRTTGPHLHYELRVAGQPVNPRLLAIFLGVLSDDQKLEAQQEHQ